uniref:Serine/threonine-protein kinase CTR1 n=1 Tax=Anthurium amnicola TaxID=1678845 RepID=A0A1D1YLQ1_9ARAE
MPQPRRKLLTLRQHPPDPCERLLLLPPASSPPHGINLLDACFPGELDVRDRDLPVGKEPIQLHRITGRPGGLRRHLPEFNDLPSRAHGGHSLLSDPEDRRPHHKQQQQQQQPPARLAADMINCGDRSPLLLRTPSLQRLPSAESSYGGSFFSGATGDGNVFSATTSPEDANTSIVVAGTNDDGRPRNWARKAQESYYLQLTLATRLASHAFLADDTYFLHKASPREICGVSSDVETVSYRLWVNGCLSFSDKICDGFYNILGMDPYLWAMCNETEEGRRLPSLGALRQVDPRDSSMEVVLVDKQSDSRLKELKEKALEFSNSLGLTVDLVQKLAKLVSHCMGLGVHLQWKKETFISNGSHVVKHREEVGSAL